jgi:hypothetical protein
MSDTAAPFVCATVQAGPAAFRTELEICAYRAAVGNLTDGTRTVKSYRVTGAPLA